MNPDINNEMVEPITTAPVAKTPHPVNQVTTFSKYLAMIIFIIMPFAGGYIGYQLAPEKVIEVPVVQTVAMTPIQPDATSSITAKSLRYIEAADWSVYLRNSDTFNNVHVIDDIHDDQMSHEIANFSHERFLQLVASTSDYKIFCVPPEYGHEKVCHDLVKYSTATHSVGQMAQSSSLEDPYYPGVVSADNRSYFVIASSGTQVGRISFDTDTYTEIKTMATPNKFFATCSDTFPCHGDVILKDAHNLKVKVYTFENCDEFDNDCDAPLSEEYITVQI